jgi:hypothetical protein
MEAMEGRFGRRIVLHRKGALHFFCEVVVGWPWCVEMGEVPWLLFLGGTVAWSSTSRLVFKKAIEPERKCIRVGCFQACAVCTNWLGKFPLIIIAYWRGR